MKTPLCPYNGVMPQLGRDVFVAPSASLIGDVVVGEASSVWFGVVVRGDATPIAIGARTNLQDNAVIHGTRAGGYATHIGDDVTVGHLALIHGCRIGDLCLVGMGSLVLDGAVLEDECFVGAGSLVPPRMRVPSRALVLGRPAKVVRTLGEKDLEEIRQSAANYVRYAREYLDEALRPADDAQLDP